MADGLQQLIARNVAGLEQLRRRAAARRSGGQRIADRVFRYAGSIRFVVIHLVLFAAWIVVNVGVIPGIPAWDPWPFVGLTTVVSLEAIMLSALVIASQNRAQRLADQHADLDLQVNLIAEHEVTRILARVDAIAQKLGIELPEEERHDVEALKQDLAPSTILRTLALEADEDDHLIHPESSSS